MGKPNFEKLQVYQLFEKLADEIWNIVKEWDYFTKDTIGKQIVTLVNLLPLRYRSSDSIGANIAVRAVFKKGRRGSI